jgi:hypothetical protein
MMLETFFLLYQKKKKNKKKIQLVWSIAGAISFGRLRHFSPTLFLNLKEKTKNKKNSGAWQFGGKK